MITKSTRGSEWGKWDLHVHTPASDGHGSPEEIVQVAIKNGLSVIAITDHHTTDYIDQVKEAAKDTSLSVISGIEFRSEYGQKCVHFIAYFPEEYNGITLNSKTLYELILCKLSLSKSEIIRKGKENNSKISDEKAFHKGMFLLQVDMKQTCDLVHSLGGIISVHNGDKANGLDDEIKHLGKAEKNVKNVYQSLGTLKDELLNNYIDICDLGVSDNDDERSFFIKVFNKPSILASDAHELNNIGNSFTWIKANPSFEGLKQILYEPEGRTSFSVERPEQKNDYQIIDSISFDNEEMGTQVIKFNQNLNTIIGGRSSGKSILLGCLATSIDPKRKAKEDTTYNQKYNTMVDRLKKKAIVTWRDKTTKPRKIIYYSQSEISEIVRPDEYGISGINDLVQTIIKKDSEKLLKIQNYEAALIANRTEINSKINDFCELKKQIDEKKKNIANIGNKTGISAEIAKIQSEIENIKKSIEGYLTEEEDKKYKKQKENVVKIGQINQYLNSDINQFNLSKEVDIFTSIDSLLSTFSQEQKEKLSAFYEDLKNETKEKWISFIDSKINELQNNQTENKNKLEEIINSELFKRGEAFQDGNTQLANKDKSLAEEKQKKYEIEKFEQEIKELNKASEDAVSTIFALFIKYSQLANELSQSLMIEEAEVRITANVAFLYKNFFENAIELLNRKEKNVKKFEDYESKTETERDTMMKELLYGITSEKFPLKKSENIQQTLINLFSNNYYKISYDVTFDGDSFTTMSEGKKAFIVLRLLLDFDDSLCPIMIDQPEDDLDNRAIYDKLVEYLRKQKSKRQIILATHNPNVVVGADSELVIVANQNGLDNKNQDNLKFEYYGNSLENSFEDKSSQTILLSKGIREHVCEILEGGNNAFEIREKKYGFTKKKLY